MITTKGLGNAVQDVRSLNVLRRQHTPRDEAPDHRLVLGQIGDHLRPDAQRSGGAGAGDFARAVDAEQRGVLAGHAQYIALAVRVDAVVAIGETAVQQRHC